MYGYAGKMLTIDLTKGKPLIQQLDMKIRTNYVGGKGFAAKIILERTEKKQYPLHPANPLVFAAGPVNGLTVSGAAKFCAAFKSPLTELWGESQCGGFFAPHMKNAGYDVIIVQGKSAEPVYLTIKDDEVNLRHASHLWGKDTFETEDAIKKDHGEKYQVLSIGPAGENLVKYACISHDKGREFGRCGAGAVMGSKKLKAIAILGTGQIEASKPNELMEFSKKLNLEIAERLKSLRGFGTPPIMSMTNMTGTLPTRYWKEGQFEGFEKISAEAIKQNMMKRSKACFACAVGCRKICKVENGPYAGVEVEGPEYETLYALGSLCGNGNLESIAKANEICDRLGMDTISAGNSLAFAMECYERGLIKRENTSTDLTFGNHEAMIAMLQKIAYRVGFGNVLAEGVRRASAMLGKGSEDFAIHVKGLEPPGYDPRGLKGVALSYAVSCRGACHLRHMAYRPNLTGSNPFREGKIDRFSYDGQAQMLAEQEEFYTLVDSMVLCKFVCLPTLGPILWEKMVELYGLVTGINTRKTDMVLRAKRINRLVRSFNRREGSWRKRDVLPSRFTSEPLKKGASEGEVVQEQKLKIMVDEYYKLGK